MINIFNWKFFIDPKKVLEEFHTVKNLDDSELSFEPKYYEFYKSELTGRPLRLIEDIENRFGKCPEE